MTILGSATGRLLGDPSLLLTKALWTAYEFRSGGRLGPGTLLSVLSIIVYQGGLTALAERQKRS